MITTHYLGLTLYESVFKAMQTFTDTRTADTPDALWVCEHYPVFTQGVAGKAEHILLHNAIPIVQSNRGGQITYHGIGQVVAYPLINLRRLNIFVKEYVYQLEESILAVLFKYHIVGHRVQGAPGIYIRLNDPFSHTILPKGDAKHPQFEGLGKIAALGIKVSQGYAYHGLSLNINMDLTPFNHINPCGYAFLKTVDMAYCLKDSLVLDVNLISQQLADELTLRLSNY